MLQPICAKLQEALDLADQYNETEIAAAIAAVMSDHCELNGPSGPPQGPSIP